MLATLVAHTGLCVMFISKRSHHPIDGCQTLTRNLLSCGAMSLPVCLKCFWSRFCVVIKPKNIIIAQPPNSGLDILCGNLWCSYYIWTRDNARTEQPQHVCREHLETPSDLRAACSPLARFTENDHWSCHVNRNMLLSCVQRLSCCIYSI